MKMLFDTYRNFVFKTFNPTPLPDISVTVSAVEKPGSNINFINSR